MAGARQDCEFLDVGLCMHCPRAEKFCPSEMSGTRWEEVS